MSNNKFKPTTATQKETIIGGSFDPKFVVTVDGTKFWLSARTTKNGNNWEALWDEPMELNITKAGKEYKPKLQGHELYMLIHQVMSNEKVLNVLKTDFEKFRKEQSKKMEEMAL